MLLLVSGEFRLLVIISHHYMIIFTFATADKVRSRLCLERSVLNSALVAARPLAKNTNGGGRSTKIDLTLLF